MSKLEFSFLTRATKQRIFDICTTSISNRGLVSEEFSQHVSDCYNTDSFINTFFRDFFGEDITEIELSGSIISMYKPYQSLPEEGVNLSGAIIAEIKMMLERTKIQPTGNYQLIEVTHVDSGFHQTSQPMLVACPPDGLSQCAIEDVLYDYFNVCSNMESPGINGDSYLTYTNNAVSYQMIGEVVDQSDTMVEVFKMVLPSRVIV